MYRYRFGLFFYFSFAFTTAFADLSLIELLSKDPTPIQSKIMTDEGKVASGKFTKALGGTLSLMNAKGDRFTLIIPAGALTRDLEITMSAISSLENTELGRIESPAGVQFEPIGEEFLKPLILKIEYSKPIAIQEQVPIASEIDGMEMYLATRSISSSLNAYSAEIVVHHFSSYGILGNPTFYEKLKHSVATAKRDRIAAWTAQQIEKDKRGEPVDKNLFKNSILEGWETGIKPLLNDIQTCQGGIDAVAVAIGLQRQIELLGLSDEVALDPNLLKVAKHKTTYLCIENAKKACYEDHRPFEVRIMAIHLSRQNALIGIENDPLEEKLDKIALKCLKFEVEFSSKMTTKTGPDEISLKAIGKALFSYLDLFGTTTSSGQIQVTEVQASPKDMNCALKSLHAEPQEMIIFGLGYDVKHDRSLGLLIGPMMPGSEAKFSCVTPDGVKFPLKIPSLWPSLFQQIHSQPRNNEYVPQLSAYRIYSWNMFWKEHFGSKTYRRTYPGASGPAEVIIEDSEFNIYHKPEKIEDL